MEVHITSFTTNQEYKDKLVIHKLQQNFVQMEEKLTILVGKYNNIKTINNQLQINI